MSHFLLVIGLFFQFGSVGFAKRSVHVPKVKTYVTLESVLQKNELKRNSKIDIRNHLKLSENSQPANPLYSVYIGAIVVGQPRHWNFGPGAGDYKLGSCVLSGASEAVLTNDACSGLDMNAGPCDFDVTITPTANQYQSNSMICPTFSRDQYGVWQPDGTLTHTIQWKGYDPKDIPKCEECEYGSIIGVDGQTLIETIPVVGTNFDLVYSSRYAFEYLAYNKLNRINAFRPHGLSVSIQHFYSTASQILYRGDGVSVPASYVPSSGNAVVVSADGQEVYIFNSSGRHVLTRYALTGSIKYSFFYDGNGMLNEIEDAFGNSTLFHKDISGNLSDIESPYGQVTSINLDSVSLLVTSVTNPLSKTHSLTYKTGTELVDSYTKPEGQVTSFLYDEFGKLTKEIGNGGSSWELITDPLLAIQPIEKISAMGRSTSYTVELSGTDYLRVKQDPTGFSEVTFEAPNGAIETNSSIKEVVETRATDGRLGANVQRLTSNSVQYGANTSVTTFGQTVVGSGYFTFTSLTETATTSGRTNTKVYTNSTKTEVTTSDEGATTTKIIDTYQRPTSFKVGTDTATTFTYDFLGRLSVVDQGGYNTLTYAYNSNGNVQSITNARSEVTSFTYDAAGNMLTTTLPDTRVVTYTYDDNGNIESVTPPSKPAHSFAYNTKELLSTYTPPTLIGVTPIATSYSYNNDKQLTSIVRPDGQTLNYNYNTTTGLLTTITWGANTNSFNYFTNSPLVSSIQSRDDVKSIFTYHGPLLASEEQRKTSTNFLFAKLNYNYDTDHRLASRVIRGNAATPTSTIITTYNDDNKPVAIGDLDLTYSYPSGRLSTTTLDNISDSRTYDARGFLASYTAQHTPSSTILYTYTLTRDAASRITGKTETLLGVTDTFVYTYDSAGRLTAVTKNGSAYSSYTYDSNGNRTSGSHAGVSFTSTFDDQDRMISYNSSTYNYNQNGDLTSISYVPSGTKTFAYDAFGNLISSTLTNGTVMTLGYDGKNRRVIRTTNGTVTNRYIYEDDYRIAGVVTNAGVVPKEFIFGTSINAPDYMKFSGSNYFFIKDHLGSTRLVVKSTDASVAQRADYTDLGKVIVNTNYGLQPYGFAGGILEGPVGVVKFGARDYDPETGRWLQKDPILFNGGDANLYGYVLQDPVNRIDPSGLSNINLFPSGERISNSDASTQNMDGSFSVGGHGNASFMTGRNGEMLSPQDIANLIKGDPSYRGESIQLNSCSTGQGKRNFAQELSNIMGVPVTAPTVPLAIGTDGSLRGSWGNFSPASVPMK